ncbi:electron transport complex subunit RsxB [Polaromonas aquatica]|uniref:electron transport complex subunit RsxB n=1 Tax=Polaromonas aquatica TaxID=332657 RepID=UPI003D651D33
MTSPAASSLFERINAALPQTQCTRCGYPDCAAYATAIATGEAAINQCPPGGAEGVQRLSAITGQPVQPLNPANGVEAPRAVAIIDENWCIGCTLCIKACPTDAIMGSNKMMHTVIEPWCTGCELCIPVCPVDCISLENITGTRTGWAAWSRQEADTARTRYEFHQARYKNPASPDAREERKAGGPPAAPSARPEGDPAVADRKRMVIEAALARARAQREKNNKKS